MTSLRQFFVTFGMIAVLCVFAGCEPAGNNSGNNNAGNSGNGGTPTEPGATNPTEPGTDPTDPTDPGTTTGNWDLAQWQAWRDAGNDYLEGGWGFAGSRRGTEYVETSAFIDWANEYFPTGIPRSPKNYGTAWNGSEWEQYFGEHPEIKENFPGDWGNFLEWAVEKFSDEDMPNTPPTGGNPYEIADGPWKLADWQRWVDSDSGEQIPGILTLTAFINWANTNFSDGIPNSPMQGNSGTTWDANEWNVWFGQNTDAAFPGDFDAFREWANEKFPGTMPNTPPSAAGSTAPATQPPALETPSTGDVVGGLIDELTGSEAATEDRSFEDAGMTEIQP